MTRLLSPLALLLALGLATSAHAQSSPLSSGAEQAALSYLREQAPAMGLTSGEAAELVVTAGHRSALSGISYVYVQQLYRGIPVVEGVVTVAVDDRGDVVHSAGTLVPGLDSPRTSSAAGVSASEALATVASLVGAPAPSAAVIRTDGEKTMFSPVAGTDVTARQVYVRSGRRATLAWEVQLPTADAQHVWLVCVDAADGSELSRTDLVVHDHWGDGTAGSPAAGPPAAGPPAASSLAPFVEAVQVPSIVAAARTPADGSSYTVYPVPYESPNHAPTVPPADGRSTINEPADATASPFGWHDTDGVAGAEFTITWGNNVRAYQDRFNDNIGIPADSPDCGAGLDCTFPLDLTQDPSAYTAAATANLFYWNNIIHDVTYQYGFDEASGNFQVNNYGNGGAGSDDVLAEAQDGSGTNNAFMFTPEDGLQPRMQMQEWSGTPWIDSDLDAGLVIHEYAHGISNRLVGGPANVDCLRYYVLEQMGEGISDYYGLMLTQQPGDTGPMRRGFATYVRNEPTNGGGIRPAPYSTSFAENAFTYGHTQSQVVPHGVGFVWATIMWEVTWELIGAYGYDADIYNASGGAGNQIALALMTEGMKLAPCSPGFVDMRDAILAADDALYGGVHRGHLWAGFARRGLGESASQGSSGTNEDNVEAFDVPPLPGAVVITPSSFTFNVAPGGTSSGGGTISNTGSPGDGTLQYSLQLERPALSGKSFAGAGGPDAFGYLWSDSGEPDGPAVNFQDISGTGTALTFTPIDGDDLPGGDEGFSDVVLPFPFPYYGTEYSSVRVYSNGFATFSAHNGFTIENDLVPGAGTPNNVIAPFWDDLDQSAGGTVYAGATTDGRFAIQWNEVPRWETSDPNTFEIIFSDDGRIEFQYGAMTGVRDFASVGIENADGTVGLQVAFRNTYVTSNKAVLFDPPILWASVTPTSGTITPGNADDFTVTVDATDLPERTYTVDLVVTTNARPPVRIPLTLVVAMPPGSAVLNGSPGWYLMASPTDDTPIDDLAGLNLVAGVPGYYPDFGNPTLYTGTDGSAWIPASGAGQTIASGQGFFWYFFDDSFTPPEPTTHVSSAVAFPVTLAAPGAIHTADTEVTLHASGTRINVFGNPFGTPLDVTGVADWPGGKKVASKGRVFVWDPDLATWQFGDDITTIKPWQGFAVRSKQSASGATLTIPASAASGGAPSAKAPEAPGDRRLLAFELSGTATGTDRPLADRALTLLFEDGGAPGWDDGDAEKFAPLSEAYVVLGALGTDEDGAGVLKAADSRAMAPASFEVPLALETVGAEAALTLRWPTLATLPAEWQVTLRDVMTGETVDLRTQEAYTFEAASGARKARSTTLALTDADASGATTRFVLSVQTGIAPEAHAEAFVFGLAAVAPNPTRGDARVSFTLTESAETTVTVYDVQGREVARLATGRHEPGRHAVTWATGAIAPGVYVVRLASGGRVETRRAVVIR